MKACHYVIYLSTVAGGSVFSPLVIPPFNLASCASRVGMERRRGGGISLSINIEPILSPDQP